MEKTTLPYLPHELIVQILLRLPVRSLIRFKCVCKSWFSLISHDNFANSHYEVTAATHTPKILFIPSPSLETSWSIDLEASLNDDNASASLNPNFRLPESYFVIEIVCSCRGFILLHTCSNKYLFLVMVSILIQIISMALGMTSQQVITCWFHCSMMQVQS